MDGAAKDDLILSLISRLDRLEAEIVVLRAENAELRGRLGLPPKTPENSSLPPSRGAKASEPAAAKPKARPHGGSHRALHPDPAERRDLFAGVCGHCGADVRTCPQEALEAYDHIEIPPVAPRVTRVTLHGGVCPACAKGFKADAPADMPKGSPFGPNLRAQALHLRFTQGIGLERLSKLMGDAYGLKISEGALVNMLRQSAPAFAAQAAAIKAGLLAGEVIASDETGMRVGKANWWLWTFHHKENAVFIAEPSRSKAVPERFLDGFRPDYWISDRYGGQLGFAARDNQVCLAHLMRDAQYAIDRGESVIAPAIRHLIARACRIGRKRNRLAGATLRSYAAKLEAALDAIMARKPETPAGLKFHRMIKKTRRHMFVFLDNREVEPTNNGSERALRPAVTFRKITNGFRAAWSARLYADIRSVLETARRRSIGALDAIRLTLAGAALQNPT